MVVLKSGLQGKLLGLWRFLYWKNKVSSIDYRIEKLNISRPLLKLSRHTSTVADHITSTGLNGIILKV